MSVCGQSHGKVRGYVGELHGALPVECAPFRDHAAGVMRRLDCARMKSCVDHAGKLGWASFTCVHCPVRDSVLPVIETRTNFDGPYPIARLR